MPAFGPLLYSRLLGPDLESDVMFVAAADFDEDGLQDVAAIVWNVYTTLPGSVVWARAAGEGAFPLAVTLDSDVFPTGIAAGDVNGDGHQDIVFVETLHNSLRVALGQGSAGFRALQVTTLTCIPVDLEVADFSGDGIGDVAVSCQGDGTTEAGSVLLLPGAETGELGLPVTIPLERKPGRLATGDLNGDGHRDVVVVNPEDDTLALLWGDGTGMLAFARFEPVAAFPRDVTAGDVTEDGHIDLLVSSGDLFDVSLLVATGQGLFEPPRHVSAGCRPTLADVTGDGHLDLIAVYVPYRLLLLSAGDGTGAFGSRVAVSTTIGSVGPTDVLVDDMNGDTRPDVLIASGDEPGVGVSFNLSGAPPPVDLSVAMVDEPDPVVWGEPLTYTATVTNNSGELARSVSFTLWNIEPARSASSSQGVCTLGGSVPVGCALGAIPPGGSATVTVVTEATEPWTAIPARAEVASHANPESNTRDNTLTLDTVVLMVGGRHFRIGTSGTLVELGWLDGNVELGYFIGRWVNGVVTKIPDRPLGPDTSSFFDYHPSAGGLNCYYVVPFDASGSLGRSLTMCAMPGLGTNQAWVQIADEPDIARVSWSEPVGGGQTGYAIVAYPMDGSPSRTTYRGPADYVIIDNMHGIPTCYVVFSGLPDSQISYSTPVCAVPGYSTMQGKASAIRTIAPAATMPMMPATTLREAIADEHARLQRQWSRH